MEKVSISTFKATCLELLKKVQRTGQPLLVTLRGKPIAEVVPARHATSARGWLDSARGTGEIVDDIVGPTGERWNAVVDPR